MAGAWVQSFTFEGNDQLTSKTLAVNTDGPATANNLLVAVIVVQAGGDSFTTPTGYTLLNDYSSGAGENWGVASYYRVASGSAADDCTFAWTDAGRPQIVIQEFSGLDSSSPFEQKAEDESNVLTSVTSQGTGTATPDTANGIAVACFACEDESVWSAASTSVGGSFSNLATAGYVARSTTGMASLPYTSTAGQSATFSTSESGYVAYGSIAVFKESAAGGATVTPGAESVVITGLAPTVSVTDNQSVTPATESVVVTGLAPAVTASNNQSVTPATESVVVTGLAPTVSVTDHQSVTPATESVVVTGFAPSVSTTGAQSVTPGTESVVVTGLAPTVTASDNQSVTPATEAIEVTGLAPTVSVSDQQLVTPATESVVITGFAPTVSTTDNVTAEPAAEVIEVVGYAPTVSAGSEVNLTPATESIVITGYAPNVIVFTPHPNRTLNIPEESRIRHIPYENRTKVA